ncbi:MAG: DNA-protecting protein DprA, partial [Rhodospirillales bacterium]|nr:DNA-protecting protein DprA [Rhodospirillales bacterium]
MTTLLTDIERRDRLRLIRSENVGPITFYRLIEQFGTATSALQALPDLSRRGGRRKTIGIYPSASAEREMESLAALNARLVAWGEPDYPPLLAHIENAPPLLSVLGESDVFARKTMAIVGTRNASANGLRLAERLAKDLGDAGVMVVSGLARGID